VLHAIASERDVKEHKKKKRLKNEQVCEEKQRQKHRKKTKEQMRN
jgi:hypothetical protein